MSIMSERIDIEQPDWLPGAIENMESTIRLMKNRHMPEALKGRFIVTSCMYMLRCVYGSNLATAAAIRSRVLTETEEWQKIDAMTPAEQKAYFASLLKEPTA